MTEQSVLIRAPLASLMFLMAVQTLYGSSAGSSGAITFGTVAEIDRTLIKLLS